MIHYHIHPYRAIPARCVGTQSECHCPPGCPPSSPFSWYIGCNPPAFLRSLCRCRESDIIEAVSGSGEEDREQSSKGNPSLPDYAFCLPDHGRGHGAGSPGRPGSATLGRVPPGPDGISPPNLRAGHPGDRPAGHYHQLAFEGKAWPRNFVKHVFYRPLC